MASRDREPTQVGAHAPLEQQSRGADVLRDDIAVSVIVPYYGRRDWLDAALDSVRRQTLRALEVIVIDDGVPDRLPPAEVGRDPRVRYVRQEHRGASAARNHGMRLARGKYIAFLDSDDLFMPDKLQIQVAEMEAKPAVGLCHTSYRRIDSTGTELEDISSGRFSGAVYPGIVTWCPIATPTVMIRRDTVEEHRLAFDESVHIGEDTLLWVQIARSSEILGIDQPLAKVRMHGRNAFADPAAQYLGGMEVIRQAIQKDPALGRLFERRAMANLLASVGYLYERQGKQGRAIRSYARAAIYWPLNARYVISLLRLATPRGVRTRVRLLRPGARRRQANRPHGDGDTRRQSSPPH